MTPNQIDGMVAIANTPYPTAPLFNGWAALNPVTITKRSDAWAMLTINRYAHALTEYNIKKRVVLPLLERTGSNEHLDIYAASDTPAVITNEWHPYQVIWCNAAFEDRYCTTLVELQGLSLKVAVDLVCDLQKHGGDGGTMIDWSGRVRSMYTRFMDSCNTRLYNFNDKVECEIPVGRYVNFNNVSEKNVGKGGGRYVEWINRAMLLGLDTGSAAQVRVFVSTFTEYLHETQS